MFPEASFCTGAKAFAKRSPPLTHSIMFSPLQVPFVPGPGCRLNRPKLSRSPLIDRQHGLPVALWFVMSHIDRVASWCPSPLHLYGAHCYQRCLLPYLPLWPVLLCMPICRYAAEPFVALLLTLSSPLNLAILATASAPPPSRPIG